MRSALQWTIIEGIVDIVSGEGPVVTDRLYELYVRASGGHRVTKPVRDALDQATGTALKKGLLEQIRDNMTNHSMRTLYLPGTPPVILRRRGDRELEHIPPTEVAAVARHILEHDTGSKRQASFSRTSPYRIRAWHPVDHQRLVSMAFLDDCKLAIRLQTIDA